MKKARQNFIILVMALFLLVSGMGSVEAAAATQEWKSGRTMAIKDYKDEVYKLELKKDTVFEINVTKNNGYAAVKFYKKFKDGKATDLLTDFTTSINWEGATNHGYVALSKGTYYMTFYGYDNDKYKQANSTAKVKVSYKAAVNKANYCWAKAADLKVKSQLVIANTKDYDYTRWYKIKVTKKSYVTIESGTDDVLGVTVYDSKGKEVSMVTRDNQKETKKKLSKGTYYIKIDNSYLPPYRLYGDVKAFKWRYGLGK